MIRPILLIFFELCLFGRAFPQQLPDSLRNKNETKLDLVPLYYDFFDSRVQLRAGIEYERYISGRTSVALYLDAGLYDKYNYIKYYNFFNEHEGLYSVKQQITVTGFHLLPSLNYYFRELGSKTKSIMFAGALLDLAYYHKKLTLDNSLTSIHSEDQYNQAKLGIGLSLGLKKQICKNLFVELKTSFVASLFTHLSEKGRVKLQSMDAQWTSPNYHYWWITNLKINYAF